MSGIVPVVKIKSTHPASQGDFVEINKADFNPDVHELHDSEAAPKAPKEPKAPKAPKEPKAA